MYDQTLPLGGDALEEFPFPIVMSLSGQSLRLFGPVSAFTRSHGWTSQHWLAPSAIYRGHLMLIGEEVAVTQITGMSIRVPQAAGTVAR